MPNFAQDYLRSVLPQIISGKAEQTAATDGLYLLAPKVQSYLKRNDPSGALGPYYTGLPAGGTIRIVKELWNSGTGAWTATNIDVNFAADISGGNALMTALIARINAADSDLRATDEGGYLTIALAVQGLKNTLTVKKGLANDVSTILGFYPYPDPRSTSRAGDLLSSPPGSTGSLPGTKFPLIDEALTSKGLGRALGAIERQFSVTQRLLYQRLPVWGQVALQVVDLGSGGREFLAKAPTGSVFLANSSISGYLVDSTGNRVYDPSDNPVTVVGISYGKTGINLAAGFGAWGTPDGKRVDSSLNTTKLKVQPTAITDVNGSIIKAAGANFLANGALVGDIVKVAGSTNHLPFNHNGEYAIVWVFDEDTIAVRPLIYGEGQVDVAQDTPMNLNSLPLAGGAVHGTVAVYFGIWAHSWLKDANQLAPSAVDAQCWFNLSSDIPLGNYFLITMVPATMAAPATSLLTPYVSEDNYAKKHLANTFIKTNTFNTTIIFGDGLKTTSGNAVIPRQQQEINSTVSSKTLIELIKQPAGQTIGHTRIYQELGGGRLLTQNAIWTGTEWLKDVANQPAYLFRNKVDNTQASRIDSADYNVLSAGNGWADNVWLGIFQAASDRVKLQKTAYFGENLTSTEWQAVFGGGGTDPRPVWLLNTAGGQTAGYSYTNKGNYEIVIGASRNGAGLASYTKDNSTSTAWRFMFNAPDANGASGGFQVYRLSRLTSGATTTLGESDWEKIFEINLGGVPGIRTSKVQGFAGKGGPYLQAKSEAPGSEDLVVNRGFLATKIYQGDTASAGSITATGALNLDEEIWVKIVTAGNPGVSGSYMISTDGGVTWPGGATSPIPASATVAVGSGNGVLLGFSAAFSANAVYAIRSARAPLAKWSTSAGKGRFSISHNGYPAGRISEIREEWKYATVTWGGPTNTTYPSADGWKIVVDGTSSNLGGTSTVQAPGGTFNSRSLQLLANNDQGGTTNRTNYLQDNLDLLMLTADTIAEFEWEAKIVHGGTADNSNVEIYMGLSDFSQPSGPAGLAKRAVFQMTYNETGTSSWECAVGDGAVVTRQVLNGAAGAPTFQIGPTVDAIWNFRIEYHGTATPLGTAIGHAVFVFFINDEQVAMINSTANLAEGTQLIRRLLMIRSVSDKSVSKVLVGPMTLRWNRVSDCTGL